MKWVGQHIVDLIARFKSDVYLDGLTTTTETNVLVVDSAGLVSKSTSVAGDLTAISVGGGIGGSDLSGPIPVLALALTGLEPITPEHGLSFPVVTEAEDHNLISIADLATLYAGTGLTATDSVIAVDASQVGITRVGTLSSLAVTSSSSLATAAMTLYNQDIDQIALDINALNTTANILDINASALTTADAINIDCTSLTTGSALVLDVNDSLTTSAAKNLVNIDYDKLRDTDSGQTSQTKGLQIDMTDAATSNVGTINMTGTDIQISSADADGTVNQTGISVGCVGGDAATTYGYKSHVTDGGTDFYARSSADAADYFSMATTTNGATTLTTVDGGAAAAHFEIAADGNIILDPQNATTGVQIDGSANTTTNILNIDADALTTGSALRLDVDDALESTAIKSLISIDYDKAGDTASAQTSSTKGLHINLQDNAVNNVGTISMTGIGIDISSSDANGTVKHHGVNVTCADGDAATTTAYECQITDGGIDFKAASSADGDDYFSIATTTNGATTLETVDGGSDNAHLSLVVDGDFSIASTGIDIAANGTITNATWQGTAVATGYTKHLMHYEFIGFNKASPGTSNGVYQYSEPMQDTKAPMEHTKDHHASITTAMVVEDFFFSGGQVMPQACTVKKVIGWFHSNGTSAVHNLALVRLRPAEGDDTDVNPVVVQETSFTSLGNGNLKAISATGLSVALNAGDILMTMIKDDTGGRTVYFNITVEVEF